MKFLELIWLAIRWSILLIIVVLIMTPWTTKNDSLWISQSKQKEEISNVQTQPKATYIPEQKIQPVYKTFGTVKLKEVYTYPQHGFYVYEYDKSNTSLDLDIVEIMTKTLKYNNEGWGLEVYIYDKKVDVTPFRNAPKQLPANLIIEADKQFPHARLMSIKDHSDSLCAYNYSENRAIYYFRSFATDWNWTQPGGDDGNCKLLVQ